MSEHVETLAPEPRSVRSARQLVAGVLDEAGHAELADTAALLVSEVVTNAVLHAGTEITIRCRTSAACVRIEVTDSSPVIPGRRNYGEEASTGRGLELVELLASRWGIDTLPGGKTLWFELGDPELQDAGEDHQSLRSAGDEFDVQFLRLPVQLVRATIQYGDAVLRELALGALDDHLARGLPPDWRLPQLDVTPILAVVDEAAAGGLAAVDAVLAFPSSAAQEALHRLALIDIADGLAQRDLLLVLPALPEITACRHWLYAQIALQGEGAPPQPWELPPPLEPLAAAAELSPEECARLDASTDAVVVADDANRIIFVTTRAAVMLGWERDDLVGRRLTTIIPARLRESHLAGFSRYQLTGEARLLGAPVRVPALRRDGTEVAVELAIERVDGTDDRGAFRATMRAV